MTETIAPPTLRASHSRVLAMFRLYGAMSDRQLMAYLHDAERAAGFQPMSPSGIRTRRAELVASGRLVATKEREVIGGRSAIVWGLPNV